MRVVDVRDFDIPSDENDYDELVAFADTMASIEQFDAVSMSVIEDIKAEIEDIYVGYRHGYEVMADVLAIIDKHIGGK